MNRRLPIGAEVQPDGGVHFRVWAPRQRTAAVKWAPTAEEFETSPRVEQLDAEPDGYFSSFVADVTPGSVYKFQFEHGNFPDPASRFQPQGPHGPSQVVDPSIFQWTDARWKGVSREGQVIYEMHIGTFTKEGTWRAALEQLPHLADLGVLASTTENYVARFPRDIG